MRKIACYIMLALCLFVKVDAADFGHYDFDVKAKGMGNSNVAVVSDIYSLDGNAAGLATVLDSKFLVSYADEFGIGFGHNNLCYTRPALGGGLGIYFNQLTNSDDLFYQTTALQLSYGRKVDAAQMQIGGSLRANTLNSEGGKANAVSMDLGIQKQFGKVNFGLAVYNLGAMVKPATKFNAAPCEFRIGVAYQLKDSMLAASLNDGELALGGVKKLTDNLDLRGGFRNGTYTFGLGVNLNQLQIDYALELGGLGNTHSLGVVKAF